MIVQRAVDYLTAVVFVNTVGGQDELVFDGHSLAVNPDGTVLARSPQFEEHLALATIDPREVVAARLLDTRHRVNVRRQRRASAGHSPRCRSSVTRPWPWTLPRSGWRRLAPVLEDHDEVYAALAPGSATTWRRTDSSTWCWRSPEESTRPWWR